MREWIVSRTILANNKDLSDWKNYNEIRNSTEKKLNILGKEFVKFESDKENNCYRLLEKWFHNSSIRNQYAHAGHQDKVVYPKKGKEIIKKLLDFCVENIEKNSMWILPN